MDKWITWIWSKRINRRSISFILLLLFFHYLKSLIHEWCEAPSNMLEWIISYHLSRRPCRNREVYIQSMSLAESFSKNLMKHFSCVSVVRWVEDLLKQARRSVFFPPLSDSIFQLPQKTSWSAIRSFPLSMNCPTNIFSHACMLRVTIFSINNPNIAFPQNIASSNVWY